MQFAPIFLVEVAKLEVLQLQQSGTATPSYKLLKRLHRRGGEQKVNNRRFITGEGTGGADQSGIERDGLPAAAVRGPSGVKSFV